MNFHMFLNREHISCFILIGTGMFFCIGGIKYKLFDSGVPGPGLLPFIGGIIVVSLGLTLLLISYRADISRSQDRESFFPEVDSFKKVTGSVLGLSLYAVVFEYIGFVVATFFLLIFLLRFIAMQRWPLVWITTFLTSAFFYFIFYSFLKVQLPKGVLGL